jgi:hypothetical protein
MAQDQPQQEDRNVPARKTFGGPLLISNQTDVVNIAKTLEWDIQHRFGTLENGSSDLFGVFASSNIRLGFSYTPINRLAVGIGLSKIVRTNPMIDYNLKYKFLQQTRSNSIPVNITYYGDIAEDSRGGENFAKYVHRFSFFNELIISRRFGPKFSAQIAPMFAHFNAVDTLYSNDIFGLSVAAKFRVSAMGSIQLEYTQPLTQHDIASESKSGSMYNKDAGTKPNIALGYEVVTTSHVFQIFFSTYRDILPQNNLVFNTNTLTRDVDGKSKLGFLIGFNITRVWNF